MILDLFIGSSMLHDSLSSPVKNILEQSHQQGTKQRYQQEQTYGTAVDCDTRQQGGSELYRDACHEECGYGIRYELFRVSFHNIVF